MKGTAGPKLETVAIWLQRIIPMDIERRKRHYRIQGFWLSFDREIHSIRVFENMVSRVGEFSALLNVQACCPRVDNPALLQCIVHALHLLPRQLDYRTSLEQLQTRQSH